MNQLTVSEYATTYKVSSQSVYQRIKRGSLKCIVEKGIKYIVIDDNTGSDEVCKVVGNDVGKVAKSKVANEVKHLAKVVKRLQKKIDSKDKEIQQLTKKLLKCGKSKEDVLINYIQELKQLQITSNPEPIEDDIIDVEPKKKKKKSKKKKSKK